ncbi:EAL and HDOD domain-containing protein [Methylophaga sp. OBS1]|uniref:EAL and HDOD domain-containing protein n=1 Tax=Methylophaga sp. OBS1 TaxID=2991933 RepID=UPI0022528E0E|nr:HDOD domain-containing protein [Methylophaga sp. OBS1]MCX4192870.1 HDOD domain-containing protein [Methylophaga sp. OBS1]
MSDSDNFSAAIIARQPILNRECELIAYELLFRRNSQDKNADLSEMSADIATSRVINYAFLELGIERVIGDHVAFINLTRAFILNDEPIPASQNKVVLELLEDIEVDDELLEGLRRLRASGYTIALDDFVFNDSLKPLVALASIVKIDILALSTDQLREHVQLLRQYDLKLLAEKVETQEAFDLCVELGFDYFQGFFFCKPDIIEDKPIPVRQQTVLDLIQRLQSPDTEFEDIERIISNDAGLTYKLLRLLNSAALALPRQIDSIREGLVRLGLKSITTWTTLIAMSEINYKPRELLDYSLVRAKMCESLASAYGCSAEGGFIVGLFSTIDAMLDRRMEDVIDPLPLSETTKQALKARSGPLGILLSDVLDYEQGRWDEISEQYASLEQLSKHYILASEWTINTRKAI